MKNVHICISQEKVVYHLIMQFSIQTELSMLYGPSCDQCYKWFDGPVLRDGWGLTPHACSYYYVCKV
jgi:hypothetical protein